MSNTDTPNLPLGYSINRTAMSTVKIPNSAIRHTNWPSVYAELAHSKLCVNWLWFRGRISQNTEYLRSVNSADSNQRLLVNYIPIRHLLALLRAHHIFHVSGLSISCTPISNTNIPDLLQRYSINPTTMSTVKIPNSVIRHTNWPGD